MRDLMNDIHPVTAIVPVVVTDGTAQISITVDTKGYDSCTFLIMTGTLADADATWAVTVEEGSSVTQSTHTAVADVDLVGTEALAGFAFGDDNACRKIGYIGGERYVSITIDDVVANSGAAPMCCVAVLGNPHSRPTSNPPA